MLTIFLLPEKIPSPILCHSSFHTFTFDFVEKLITTSPSMSTDNWCALVCMCVRECVCVCLNLFVCVCVCV